MLIEPSFFISYIRITERIFGLQIFCAHNCSKEIVVK